MTVLRLSSRQREILDRLDAGAVLRWAVYRNAWRYVLDGQPVDGRAVDGLLKRGLAVWTDLYSDLPESSYLGRHVVRTQAGR